MTVSPALELLPGEAVRIGGVEYVMPAPNLKALRRAIELIPKLQSESLESVDACLEIVHMILRRNYPDLTLDQLEEAIDLDTLTRLTATVVAQVTAGAQLVTAPPPAAPPLELSPE